MTTTVEISHNEGKPEKSEQSGGWRLVRLGEICERIDYGFTASADFAKSEPRFLRITDIQNGVVEWQKVPGCNIAPNEEADHLLADGDIVFARTGATTGKSFLIKNPPRAVFASYLIRLRIKAEIDSEFIYNFFQSASYWRQIQAKARGGAQPNVNATLLAEIEIPLPPLAEQKRIAGILREQMAAVECARVSTEAQLQAAENLPAAYLSAVFNNGESKSWPRKPFGELVENFDGRRVPVKLEDRRNKKGSYPYYGASGIIDFVNEYLFDGDFLLIGEDGANLVLRSSPIAFKASGKFWVNNHAHVVQPKEGMPLDYLLFFFGATDLKPYVTGAAQPKLTQEDLNSIPVPVPQPADLQRITVQLKSQMASAERLRGMLAEQLDTVNKLAAALLRRAFNGEV